MLRSAWIPVAVLAAAPALVALLPLGCGGAQQPQPQTQPSDSSPELAVEDAPLPPLPPGHVWRVQVMRVMSPGMPAFLRRLEVQERLSDQGRFLGWNIVRLTDAALWKGVDLRPGDLVVAVNGRSVGHYDEAFKVWRSMVTAPELVVAYERAGQKRELRFVVHDDEPDAGAGVRPPAASGWPPASAAPPGSAAPALDAGGAG